jgi:hypothetical protein
MPPPSTSTLQDLRQQFDNALKAPAPAAAPQVAVAADFCSVWPTAKPVLQAVAGVIGFIPGVGAGAGPILNALITVGDQVYGATCKSTNP